MSLQVEMVPTDQIFPLPDFATKLRLPKIPQDDGVSMHSLGGPGILPMQGRQDQNVHSELFQFTLTEPESLSLSEVTNKSFINYQPWA